MASKRTKTPALVVQLNRSAQRIYAWLVELPGTWTRVQLGFAGVGGLDVLLELEAEEVADKPWEVVAQSLWQCADEQAESNGREQRALLIAYRDERIIARHPFKVGIPADEDGLDGSVDSVLAQTQRHTQSIMRMHTGSLGMLTGAWRDLLQLQGERIKVLEAENTKLRRLNSNRSEEETAIALAEIETGERKSQRLFELAKVALGGEGKKLLDAIEIGAELLGGDKETDKGKGDKQNGKRERDPKPEKKT